MDYSKITLGELLSSENITIRRHATGILKQLQKTKIKWCPNCQGFTEPNYNGDCPNCQEPI